MEPDTLCVHFPIGCHAERGESAGNEVGRARSADGLGVGVGVVVLEFLLGQGAVVFVQAFVAVITKEPFGAGDAAAVHEPGEDLRGGSVDGRFCLDEGEVGGVRRFGELGYAEVPLVDSFPVLRLVVIGSGGRGSVFFDFVVGEEDVVGEFEAVRDVDPLGVC